MKTARSVPLGCRFEDGGAVCRLWAPSAEKVVLVVRGADGGRQLAMVKDEEGLWSASEKSLRPGDDYAFRIDGKGPFPDPASRSQPEGVHGFSRAVDTTAFTWKHAFPKLPSPARRSLYELHVGTFSPQGTFEGARQRLGRIRDLGISLIEIMPVSDFPGARNWGYDGVYPFAPSRNYGGPEELAALIDEAHGMGLGVILDVVYNHFGPDGNYLPNYNPGFFDPTQRTPWGEALNFTGKQSEGVRAFFLENALYWLREFRFDGLRLDATHAYCDSMEEPFAGDLREAANKAIPDREILIYAEDERHPSRYCKSLEEGGAGLTGVWADDWHHHVRRRITGDHEGYYEKYDGSLSNIAALMENGWKEETSGSDPGFRYDRFVFCLQNHDQVGNRAFGERLHHQISPELYGALSSLLLLAPETPLLFMGQEWAVSSPFQYFTDHEPELGKKITEGRRKEFEGFSQFQNEASRNAIPDPQHPDTFLRSRLDWEETAKKPHAAILRFYQRLLEIRNVHPALDSMKREDFNAIPFNPNGLVLHRRSGDQELILAAWLGESAGRIALPGDTAEWNVLLTSESMNVAGDSQDIRSGLVDGRFVLEFPRAGAWVAEKIV